MISYLEGRALNTEIIVTNGGVGYKVKTVRGLQQGEEYRLWIEPSVNRDGEWSFFGFEKDNERSAFIALTKVQKVGPSVALNVIQSMGLTGLAQAAANKDAKAFAKVKGIGATVAKNLATLLVLPTTLTKTELEPSNVLLAEITEALVKMGYEEEAAAQAVKSAQSGAVDKEEAELLAAALVLLAEGS